MKKITVTIEGFDNKTMRYIADKISPVPGGLRLDLSKPSPAAINALTAIPNAYHLSRKKLIILTPFYDDHSPLPLVPSYRAVIRSRDPGEIPKEYCFRSPFSLRKELEGIKEKFGMDLTNHIIIFCVKRKGTENNWRGSVQYIERGEEIERSD